MLKPQPMFRFGDAAQVHRHHQDLRGQFRALGLEMMLGHPEGVVAQLVQLLGVGHGLVQGVGQHGVGVVAVVDRRAEIARIFQVYRADIRAVELRYHGRFPNVALECARD